MMKFLIVIIGLLLWASCICIMVRLSSGKMKKNFFSISLVVFFYSALSLVGILSGYDSGKINIKKEAVRQGYMEIVIDKDNNLVYSWISENLPKDGN